MFFGGGQSQAHSSQVMTAELALTQFIALHNLPFQAADHLSILFPLMFPDSKVAADFSCRHTKTKAIICDALDPYKKEPIINLLQSSPYNLLCDESNERGDLTKLLTILIRFYDPVQRVITTRHIDTVGIQDLTAQGVSVLKKQLKLYL